MTVDGVSSSQHAGRGVKQATEEIMQTFKVDKIVAGPKAVDRTKASGNQVLDSGITNSIQLGKDTGSAKISGNGLVGNNNILDTWKKGYADKPRDIVMDYSKKPSEKAGEQIHGSSSGEIDLTA